MNTNKYRTIFSAIIKQKTALTVGGSEGDSSSSLMFRDGLNRLTIPATSVAGAFCETAMRLFPELEKAKKGDGFKDLRWEHLTGKRQYEINSLTKKKIKKDIGDTISAFCFENLHPIYEENDKSQITEMRQGVGIDAFTGTSADKSLFDFEIVPAGTKWKLFLEVDTSRTGVTGEYVASLVLNEWEKGYGWLGKNNTRGCGWFELNNICVIELPLTEEALEKWPNSTKTFKDAFDDVKKLDFTKEIPFSELVSNAKQYLADKISKDWYYIKMSYSIEPGSSDGYGYDFLQSGGHAANADYSLEPNVLDSMLVPISLKANKNEYLKGMELDKPFPMTYYYEDGEYKPFLPGSTVKGAFRSIISRIKRGENKKKKIDNNGFWGILDPNSKKKLESRKFKMGDLEELFGIAIQRRRDENEKKEDDICSSNILFSDAMLEKNSSFSLVQQEQHAEDEFCAGVYGTGKFDSTVLIKGKLCFDIIIEGKSRVEVTNNYKLISKTLDLAKKGWVPIGGGVFKGFGWLKWVLDKKQSGLRKIADDTLQSLEANL